MPRPSLLPVLAALCAVAFSLPACADEFPDGASPLTPDQVTETFSGKSFNVKVKDGTSWHFDFKTGGDFNFLWSKGARDTGVWKVEDSKLCTRGAKYIDPSCNEVRKVDGKILFKRDNGDIVEFVEAA